MLTEANILIATEHEPKSNKQLAAELGAPELAVHHYTANMAAQSRLLVIPCKEHSRRKLFKCFDLQFKLSRSAEQVAADTNIGITRQRAARAGLAKKYPGLLEKLRSMADRMILAHGFCTTDIPRDRVADTLHVPEHLWGCVFRVPSRYKKRNPATVPSSIKTNNGRGIYEWVFSS